MFYQVLACGYKQYGCKALIESLSCYVRHIQTLNLKLNLEITLALIVVNISFNTNQIRIQVSVGSIGRSRRTEQSAVRIRIGKKSIFCSSKRSTCPWVHSASSSTGTGVLSGDKAARVWSWPLTSIFCRG